MRHLHSKMGSDQGSYVPTVDVLGPFPVTGKGNYYILVAMDYFTQWPEMYAVPDQSATPTAVVKQPCCIPGI